jgi:hypothetical protein
VSTTTYFEEKLYPTDETNGRANKTKPEATFELFRSNYFGDDQIYLRITNAKGQENTVHLTKTQASNFAEGLQNVVSYIGYNNT